MDTALAQMNQLADTVTNPQATVSSEPKTHQQEADASKVGYSVNDDEAIADNVNMNATPAEDFALALDEVNQFVQSQNTTLTFSFDDSLNRTIVEVIDSETGELIRQIPSEELIQLSERIRNLLTDVGSATGIFFNKEV